MFRTIASYGVAGICGLLIACSPAGNAPSSPSAPAPAPSTQAGNATSMASVLALHNKLRAQHCTPALAWSEQLAEVAQTWANRCEFKHSFRKGLGENLAIGTVGFFTPESFVQSWYDEIESYDYATGRTRDGKEIGHFTQVVWANSTEVGCAVARCGQENLMVCNYTPQGNFFGSEEFNVLPRC